MYPMGPSHQILKMKTGNQSRRNALYPSLINMPSVDGDFERTHQSNDCIETFLCVVAIGSAIAIYCLWIWASGSKLF